MVEGYREKTGIQITAYTYYGARQTTSNRPFTDCAGMKGLKIRVPDVPAYMATPKACGANPTPIAFAEVYLALQNGTVDAQENPLTTIEAKKFYEVQKAIMLTSHIVDGADDADRAARLDQADRRREEDLHRRDARSRRRATAQIKKREAELVDEFKKKGLQIVSVDQQELRRRGAEELDAGIDGLHEGRLRPDRRDQVVAARRATPRPAGARRRASDPQDDGSDGGRMTDATRTVPADGQPSSMPRATSTRSTSRSTCRATAGRTG